MNPLRHLIALTLLAALVACGDSKSKPAPEAQADPDLVEVKEQLLTRLSIAPAGMSEIAETLRMPARIEVDEQRVARLGPAVTGRIAGVEVSVGERVKRGSVLATMHSPELSAAQMGYMKAVSMESLQERAAERARLLFASDVISQAELQRRESELAQARTERQAMHDQLSVLGMTEGSIRALGSQHDVRSQSSVTATLDGVVIERNVTQGQMVQPTDVLFTVADLSHVWLVAEVPEQQVGLLKQGETALAEIPALENRRISGKLIYVADTVRPETRSVVVRMDVENADRALKPGMLVSMLLQGQAQRRVVVPAEAVVREGNRDHLFVQVDKTHFRLVPVKLGPENEGSVAVLDGIKEGEQIVVGGAFHLNNERRRQELEGA
jgi:cobalt-zinc-cadmium efflux system membrane fusion protein